MHQTFTLVSKSFKSKNNKQPKLFSVDDFEPSCSIVNNILNYSKSLTIKKAKSVGFIEIVAS
jgi:hypothetical protein